MALFYKSDGTADTVIVNYIVSGSGAVTSTITPPNIQQSLNASASNAIFSAALSAGSSSAQAYNLAYPTGSPNNAGYTYLSSATKQRTLGVFVQYPLWSGSAASGSPLYDNGVLVSSSAQANFVLYGNGLKHDYTQPIMVSDTYVFKDDLDTVYGKDSDVAIINNFINETSASFATAFQKILLYYKITGSISNGGWNDASASAAGVPVGGLYYSNSGSLHTGSLRVRLV